MSVQFWPGAHFDFKNICAIVEKPMDEQERKKLEEVLKLSQENNVMVRKLVKYHKSAIMWRIFYWSLIIGSTIIAYYSIQPYISSITKFFTGRDFSIIIDSLSALPKQ